MLSQHMSCFKDVTQSQMIDDLIRIAGGHTDATAVRLASHLVDNANIYNLNFPDVAIGGSVPTLKRAFKKKEIGSRK